ncbi:MAG TPA: hypothetical protein VHC22_01400 [Pirellulales bacterium]|nr:hypothetical protein [Pirellulales bacterium]
MSGPIVRSGPSPEFSKNWESVFGKKTSGAAASAGTAAKTAKKAPVKKAAKKAAPKKAKKSR